MAKLERRAELVKANVITASEDRIADHQSELLSGHIADYLQSLRARDVSAGYLKETKRLISRIVTDCEYKRLGDIDLTALERWLVARKAEGMSARTRNSHVQAVAGFCSWAVDNQRLASNPLSRIGKADEKSDKRRQRRSLTESETYSTSGNGPMATAGGVWTRIDSSRGDFQAIELEESSIVA